MPYLNVRLRPNGAKLWSDPIRALVDTGAAYTLASIDVLSMLRADESELHEQLSASGDGVWMYFVVDGQHKKRYVRRLRLDLFLGTEIVGETKLPAGALVVPDVSVAFCEQTLGEDQDLLLGQDPFLYLVQLVHRNAQPDGEFTLARLP